MNFVKCAEDFMTRPTKHGQQEHWKTKVFNRNTLEKSDRKCSFPTMAEKIPLRVYKGATGTES